MIPVVAAPPSVAALGAGRRRTLSPVTAVITAATLLALALRLYQLSRPGYLLGVTEYDDGPYFGSALRLLSGAVPYRDFVIVQPPGITLLMLPAALLSKLTGTAWAMAAGRILTALAGTCSVPLAGRLVRHRGVAASVLACGVTAVFPDAIATARTVMVEPWLTLFCLLAAAAAFDRDQLAASPRRLAWAGAAFGFAGAIEVWAIFPVIGLLILLLRTPKNAAIFVTTVTAGFGIPVLPFAILAPGRLYNDIVQAQGRAEPIRVPIVAAHGPSRLREMTGLTSLHPLRLARWRLSIAVDRFTSTRPGCPLLIDSVATNYAMTGGHDPRTGASKYPKLVAIWHNAFSHAQYVWLSRQANLRIPWTTALRTYFHDRFARIPISPTGVLYQRATNATLLRSLTQRAGRR